MLQAFINIKVKATSIKDTIEKIKEMTGVKRLFTMTGESDLLVNQAPYLFNQTP